MKKTSKTLCLLLCAAMLIALATGCGKPGDSKSELQSAPAETKAPASSQTDAPPPAPEAQPEENGHISAGGISYPLVDEQVSVTQWSAINPQVLQYIDHMGENYAFMEAAEKTGVYLDATSIAGNLAFEAFAVMSAGGDYCDIIGNVASFYPPGVDAAIDDGLIIDISSYLDSCMPDYKTVLEKYDLMRAAYTDDGNLGVTMMINTDTTSDGGLLIRQDWLDRVDMEAPVTYDELHDVLAAFKSELGAESPFWNGVFGTGLAQTLCGGYNLALGMESNGSCECFSVENGEVRCGFVEKEFAEMLAMLNAWYEEGLLLKDFATDTSGESTITTSNFFNDFLNGKIGVVYGEKSDIDSLPAQSSDEDLVMSGISDPVLKKGDINRIGEATKLFDYKWSVSSSCKDVELVCKYINYFYTEEGSIVASYGAEGLSWERAEDGGIRFTELVTNNPEGMAFKMALNIYAMEDNPCLIIGERYAAAYSAEATAAGTIWANSRSAEDAWPDAVSMTADESGRHGEVWTDIRTYVLESVPKFISGELDLEGDMEAFTAKLYEMGIQTCIDLRQQAYERYLTR